MGTNAPRLGFLYPGHAAEDDYPRMAEMLSTPVSVHVAHTEMGEDAHRTDALLEIGGPERLHPGADQLRGAVDVIVWACTSGSFVFGPEGAREQADELAAYTGVPASSTSWAFTRALEALDIEHVAIAATYPLDIAQAFERFLEAAGIEVVGVGAEDIVTAAEVGTLPGERVLDFVSSGDHSQAQAVLVPDTALHTVEVLGQLEDRLGKPVLTANQVSMWEALRLADRLEPQPGLGQLFSST